MVGYRYSGRVCAGDNAWMMYETLDLVSAMHGTFHNEGVLE